MQTNQAPDQKNLIIAIALSILIVLAFEFFYKMPRDRERALEAERAARDAPAQVQQPAQQPAPGATPAPGAAAPGAPAVPALTLPTTARSRAEVIAGQPRVTIETPRLQGSIALRGGRIDDLLLSTYRETTDSDSPPITLLSPVGTEHPYFAQYGWAAAAGVAVPNDETEWTADRTTLTPAQPVTLSWDNGQGLRFERRIAIDERYMFTITDRVTNTGSAPVSLASYGLVQRIGTPHTSGFYILHEGPIGVFNNTLQEYGYSDLRTPIQQRTVGGWLGFTDKYWLVALVPNQSAEKTARLQFTNSGAERYQTDVTAPAESVAPGATYEVTNRLFAGAKEVDTLDNYASTLGIPLFDRAIDFGWFYFLTKPIFKVLDFFGRTIGNFGIAILLLTIIIKALFFPLANRSYRSMSKMKLLQPEMEKIREKYGDDRQKMSQAMMELYKKSGANPVSGCLPMIVQIPVFFALYKVLFITIEMRHAPFFGWIQDLSSPDPTTIFNLFGLLPFTPPAILPHLGVWPLIMGGTMFLQQKLNPQPADPVQAKLFLFMPLIFTFLLANFASGLVIYWAWNNLLSICQQWMIMRNTPKPK